MFRTLINVHLQLFYKPQRAIRGFSSSSPCIRPPNEANASAQYETNRRKTP